MLGGIPIVGPGFVWLGQQVCWVLQQPSDLVVGTAKATCGLIFGGTCS